MITVLVTPVEAEDLSRAEREGKIYISLRNPRDDSVRTVKRVRQPDPPKKEWGMTVTKQEDQPKPRKRVRRKKRRKSVNVAARIKIFRGK